MADFDYFVIFAEMRTGSNFLEANLNTFSGLRCHGEAFNPSFVGYPNATDVLGVDRKSRDADPARLVHAIRDEPGVIGGFRFFHDHDLRVLDPVLDDPRCGKIILTRNPAESYVSWKIAQQTGQWKLTNARHARVDQAQFDAAEFEGHLGRLQDFQVYLLGRLQRSGQSAFYIDYEDLQDVAVINGLAGWLGLNERIETLDRTLKKQNPEPLDAKVSNFSEMERALGGLDRFNLSRTPNFEPRRGPAIPTYLAAQGAGLLYLPIRGAHDGDIVSWLTSIGGGLDEGFNQKTLRQWMRRHTGFRSFAVLAHPVERAHAAFCRHILSVGPGSFSEIRNALRKNFALPIPVGAPDASYDTEAHRAAFLAYLRFAKANIAGQTALRTDPAWATQTALVQGISGFSPPDVLLRRGALASGARFLSSEIGLPLPPLEEIADPDEARLKAIYNADVEMAARDAYQRDYIGFGFGDWGDQAA